VAIGLAAVLLFVGCSQYRSSLERETREARVTIDSPGLHESMPSGATPTPRYAERL
jgi:hypothetical protein